MLLQCFSKLWRPGYIWILTGNNEHVVYSLDHHWMSACSSHVILNIADIVDLAGYQNITSHTFTWKITFCNVEYIHVAFSCCIDFVTCCLSCNQRTTSWWTAVCDCVSDLLINWLRHYCQDKNSSSHVPLRDKNSTQECIVHTHNIRFVKAFFRNICVICCDLALIEYI